MPDLLTDAEIDEIRGRAEAATPGPWQTRGLRPSHVSDGELIIDWEGAVDRYPVKNIRRDEDGCRNHTYVAVVERCGLMSDEELQANAHLIAASRTDIPRLLATLSHERSLRIEAERERDRMREALSRESEGR